MEVFFCVSVNQGRSRSATNSPAQATMTSASEIYSPHSQRESDRDNDSISEAVKIILAHKRRERNGLLVCFCATLTVLIVKVWKEFIIMRQERNT